MMLVVALPFDAAHSQLKWLTAVSGRATAKTAGSHRLGLR